MRKTKSSLDIELGYRDSIKDFQTTSADKAIQKLSNHKKSWINLSEWNTRRIASIDAKHGTPSSNASEQGKSERESKISQEANKSRSAIKSFYNRCIIDAELYLHSIIPLEIKLDSIIDAAKFEENKIRENERLYLQEARNTHIESLEELKLFRIKHKSHLNGRRPNISKSVYKALFFLFLVMLIETGINALLFKQAMSTGLLGGLTISSILSLINVGTGVLLGFFGFRYLFHSDILKKLFGGLVTLVVIPFGFIINISVAHFRDSMEEAIEQLRDSNQSLAAFNINDIQLSDIVSQIGSNPFAFDSIHSILLLLLGIMAFLFGSFEGYDKLTDKFPGYGKVWRKEKNTFATIISEASHIRDQIHQLHSKYETWINDQQEKHMLANREIHSVNVWLKDILTQSNSMMNQVLIQQQHYTTVYRRANERQRIKYKKKLLSNASPPSYFSDETIEIPEEFLDLNYEEQKALLMSMGKIIQINIYQLELSRGWLNKYFITLEEEFDSFFQKEINENNNDDDNGDSEYL